MLVQLNAVDAAGNDLFGRSTTWYPVKSLPFSTSQSSDAAAFGTTYAVSVRVVVPETGAVVASATRTVSTPAARVATCATVSNLGGTAGYYPGTTTAGALWLSYSVRNCGGREWLDTTMAVVDDTTGGVVGSYPNSSIVAANGSTGVGLFDVEPVPTGTPYHVEVEVHRHSTGELLDHSSLALVTPPTR